MSIIEVEYFNEVYCKINADKSIYTEMSSYFTFTIPNFAMLRKMNPKWWNFDGKIRLFDGRSHKLPYGLLSNLKEFCNDRKYKLVLDEKFKFNINKITSEEFQKWIDGLNLTLTPRDYQFEGALSAVRAKRKVVLVPTSGGKSLILSLFLKWAHDNTNGKCLVVVPSIQLVRQLQEDYKSYGLTEEIHEIMAGKEKTSEKRVWISTWQSLFKLEESYFKQFETIILDECIRSGTKIYTNNGYVNIEDIKVGDMVLSYNESLEINEFKEVLNHYKNLHNSSSYDHFLKIELDNGKILECTPNHKVYTTNRGYIKACDLNENDDILNFD